MKNIDWTKYSAIAEILSAVAIVATLIYLAVQTQYLRQQTQQQTTQIAQNQDLLRQNNESLIALSRYNQVDMLTDFFRRLASDSELSAVLVKARGSEQLSPVETFQLEMVHASIFAGWQWEFAELGRISAPVDGWISLLLECPHPAGIWFPRMRQSWEARKATWPAEFVSFLDSRLAVDSCE